MSTVLAPVGRKADAYRVAVAPITGVKVRDTTGVPDSWTIEGYAAVYEQETTLYDLSWIRVREEIAAGAFTDVLHRVAAGQELVHLNFGHDMNTSVASSGVRANTIGGLELSEDSHGLRFFARVDAKDPDAQRLAVKMSRGVVKQASFAFNIGDEEIVEDGVVQTADGVKYDEKWRINTVSHLFDVCVAAQGAYPQTEAYVRSLAQASLARAGMPKFRADVASVSLLTEMYEIGQEFIAAETDPDDGPDREAMATILEQLNTLIEVEATETGRASAGRPHRAHAGALHIAASPGAGDRTLELQLLKEQARARTLTLKRRAR